MENSSSFDINIRNVDVRLNDPLVVTNMNGDCDNSIYISKAEESETQVTQFRGKNDVELSATLTGLSDDLREKLHICNDTSNCGLKNGCHKTLHEDLKRMDFSVNGITKCDSFGIFNSHFDKINHRTCDQSMNCIEISNKDYNSIEKELPTNEVSSNCLSEQISTIVAKQVDKQNCVAQITNTEVTTSTSCEFSNDENILYLGYKSESQMPDIMRLIQKDLSEPYSIYTYRYFIHNWPRLCFLAQYGKRCVGAIVCKLDVHKKQSRRGYIAMLAVDEEYRKRKIGSNLVLKAIHAMVEDNADEVVLETEITNRPALKLYENLGFVRDKRLFRYYLNGVDALRLKLWLR